MKTARGFSLIEMAFVLVIVTLLLGGLLVPFSTQVEQKRIAETQKGMEEIKEALLGFAVANGRLPCPATSATNGLEATTCPLSSGAINITGFLPWATLGTARTDSWGRLYLYAISPDFTTQFGLPTYNNSGTCLTNCSLVDIKTRDTNGNLTALASNTTAIIISLGKNGYGGTDANGNSMIAASSTDEITNVTANNNFVWRVPVPPATPCGGTGQPLCEFDDLVTWLSPNVLFNRMVAAGKLP